MSHGRALSVAFGTLPAQARGPLAANAESLRWARVPDGPGRTTDRRRVGVRVRMRQVDTALFARGPVKSVEQGRLLFDAHFTFATGTLKDGKLQDGQHAFAGAWVGQGQGARKVKAATRAGVVVLKDDVAAESLEQAFASRNRTTDSYRRDLHGRAPGTNRERTWMA